MGEFKGTNEKTYPSRILKERCPWCGRELATDEEYVWCLNVSGDDGEGRGCSYGMRETVLLKERKP
jgi:hypothetical protein